MTCLITYSRARASTPGKREHHPATAALWLSSWSSTEERPRRSFRLAKFRRPPSDPCKAGVRHWHHTVTRAAAYIRRKRGRLNRPINASWDNKSGRFFRHRPTMISGDSTASHMGSVKVCDTVSASNTSIHSKRVFWSWSLFHALNGPRRLSCSAWI